MSNLDVIDEIDDVPKFTGFNTYDTLPWIEKYRPKSLDGIISHYEVISTLKTFIKNRCIPHLLFYGPPGTGKT